MHGELKSVGRVERNKHTNGKKGKMKNKKSSDKEDGFGDDILELSIKG